MYGPEEPQLWRPNCSWEYFCQPKVYEDNIGLAQLYRWGLSDFTYNVRLDGEDGRAAAENAETVLVGLAIEDLPARQGDDTGLDTLGLKLLGRLEDDADLATGRDEGDILAFDLVDDVTTLERTLNSRRLEVRQVLT